MKAKGTSIVTLLALAALSFCWVPSADALGKEKPEIDVIRWGRGNSGNALVTIARKLGYFDEVGLTIKETPLDGDDALSSLVGGQVDVLSNNGTNMPLRYISAGDKLTIFGGHMLTGCMPVIARKGTGWKGVEDLLGKKVAGNAGQYAVTGPLLDLGHNPAKEIEWIQIAVDSDKLAAVINGVADYAVMGTGRNYAIQNMKDQLEVVTYCSDLTPNYSCCRMETRDEFIQKNPIAIKLLLKCLIRAQAYYESHKEEVVGWMAEELGTSKEYVAAYMLNEHYRINVDPIRNPVVRAWNYMDRLGVLEKAEGVKLEDHINIELYKAALDEVVAEHRSEDPEFYDRMVAFYKENNL